MLNKISYSLFDSYPEISCDSFWEKQNSNDSDSDFAELLESDHLSSKQLVFAKQVHGNRLKYYNAPGEPESCDGLYTDRTGFSLLIRTADCAAVMIYNSIDKSIMNIHVGWRGAKSKIIEKALQTVLKKSGQNKAHLWAAVSPMIGPCCYQVGPEFYDYFGEQYLQQRESKIYFNLPHLIENKLIAGGVSVSQIQFANECTCCSSLKLPSFRRDKTRSRIINIIEIKEN